MLNFFFFLIFIKFLLISSLNIIVIPFKICKKENLIIENDPLSFIDNNIDNYLYTYLLLGEPAKNITSIISFNVEDFSMHHKLNNNFVDYTLYKRNGSKTFKKMSDIYNISKMNKEYFKEQVTFYNDLNFKNIIQVKDLLFSLIENEKEKKVKNDSTLCLNIGFQLPQNLNENEDNSKIMTNIIIQLKEKNIISSYCFNLHFNSIKIKEENYDGFIVIGSEPHQYLKNIYNEYQLYKTMAFKKDNILSWDIHFNKIYYLNLQNDNEIIIDKKVEFYNQATLSPNEGLIIGTKDYEKNIKYDYFDKLIYKGKCRRENKKFMIFYYCYKMNFTKEEMEKFPTLYFSNTELDYEFELNYEDLFLEKNDLIYFLVIFYDFPEDIQNYLFTYISRWELGAPFMKKYFFTYDYDNKYIGFYNNRKLIQSKKKNKIKYKKIDILHIFLILVIFTIILGMLFIRNYIFKFKKMTAIELENNDINTSLKAQNDSYNIEMIQKI